jgi:cyclophilin family peptidyl-prolyl cis-trans isomerase
LSYVNTGPDSNTAQFMIPTADAPHLNNIQVVFGVLLGQPSYDLLHAIERSGSDAGGLPSATITITDCGQLHPMQARTSSPHKSSQKGTTTAAAVTGRSRLHKALLPHSSV